MNEWPAAVAAAAAAAAVVVVVVVKRTGPELINVLPRMIIRCEILVTEPYYARRGGVLPLHLRLSGAVRSLKCSITLPGFE